MKAAFDAEMEAWRAGGRIRRLWAGDTSLWTGTDEDKWLGWLDIVEQELADVDRLNAFAKDVKQRGFTDLVLLGMGGSSLGPEVFGKTFGRRPVGRVSTCWTAPIRRRSRRSSRTVNLAKTLFIVSSKSGSTLEPNIFLDYFLDRVGSVRGQGQGRRAFRRGDRSGLVAREACQASSALPISFTAPPRSAGATPCCRNSAWCRRRRWASTSSVCLRRRSRCNAILRRRRAAGGESRRATRHRHGRCGSALSAATR